MAMTKRDFIALAGAFKATRPLFGQEELDGKQWRFDVARVADFCQSQNPNFNRDRWLGYIKGENGPSGGKL